MKASSQKFQKRRDDMFKQTEIKQIANEEILEMDSESLDTKISYFGFIEELNRFGRIFEKTYNSIIPDYYRIRFYRNKVVEHWDQYDTYFRSMGTGFSYQRGKLVAQSHLGAINTPPTKDLVYQELRTFFKNCGVNLPPLDISMTTDNRYSETVFNSLEKIDSKLNKDKIPDGITIALLKYSFPNPINDIDAYIEKLLNWFENIVKDIDSTRTK